MDDTSISSFERKRRLAVQARAYLTLCRGGRGALFRTVARLANTLPDDRHVLPQVVFILLDLVDAQIRVECMQEEDDHVLCSVMYRLGGYWLELSSVTVPVRRSVPPGLIYDAVVMSLHVDRHDTAIVGADAGFTIIHREGPPHVIEEALDEGSETDETEDANNLSLQDDQGSLPEPEDVRNGASFSQDSMPGSSRLA